MPPLSSIVACRAVSISNGLFGDAAGSDRRVAVRVRDSSSIPSQWKILPLMQLGIVGLPFSGKSTLFQAVTKTHLASAAASKGDTHLGVAKVPDARLDRCAAIFSPKSTVHATIEFVDVAGLKKGASGTTQFTTGFLSAVKTNDALIQVVRLFHDDAVPHPDGSIDPLRDVATFETEFILADMGVLEPRIEKIHKQLGRANDEQMKRELPVLEKCLAVLENDELEYSEGLVFKALKTPGFLDTSIIRCRRKN